MSTLNTPIQHCTGSLSSCSMARERNKRHRDWKGRNKMSLFTNDMVVSGENPKEFTQKTNQQKSFDYCKFSRVSEYKVSIPKSISFL